VVRCSRSWGTDLEHQRRVGTLDLCRLLCCSMVLSSHNHQLNLRGGFWAGRQGGGSVRYSWSSARSLPTFGGILDRGFPNCSQGCPDHVFWLDVREFCEDCFL
jgi:hypothetical protein